MYFFAFVYCGRFQFLLSEIVILIFVANQALSTSRGVVVSKAVFTLVLVDIINCSVYHTRNWFVFTLDQN